MHGCRRSGFYKACSRPLVTTSSTPTSPTPTSTSSTSSLTSSSSRLQSRGCCTVSIPVASLLAYDVMDVWICSFFVFLACGGFVDLSCVFEVLVYLFLIAISLSRIKLILDHVNFVTPPWLDLLLAPARYSSVLVWPMVTYISAVSTAMAQARRAPPCRARE
jgi:hypothetical protein